METYRNPCVRHKREEKQTHQKYNTIPLHNMSLVCVKIVH